MSRGFTLIQISLLLIVASLVMVTMLPGLQTTVKSNDVTVTRLNNVLSALRTYQASHGRLPCPADAAKPIGDTNYGVEAANPGDTTNCTGGSPEANYTDATNHVALGMLPVKTMGLPNDYALDAYGRDITYAVDTSATALGWATAVLTGHITVTDNGTGGSTVAALVSHGTDGHGAWIPRTGNTGSAVRLNSGSTDTDQLTNAHVDSSFIAIAALNNVIKKMPTATFDDLVMYKSPLWTINNIPASIPRISSVIPPAFRCYTTGQVISFTLVYTEAVTVTNTPRLAFTLGSHTRYANYASGSGSAHLEFHYTVQVSDFAVANISVGNAVDPNDGGIMSGLAYAVRALTPPDMTGVEVNSCVGHLWVADYGNWRIQKLSKDGNYLGQFSSNHSYDVAVDSSDNVYAIYATYYNIRKYDKDGNYLGTMGDYPTLGFVTGITVDQYDNIWATDPQRNAEFEFDPGGTIINSIYAPCGNAVIRSAVADGKVYMGVYNTNLVCVYDSALTTHLFDGYAAHMNFGITVNADGNIWAANEWHETVSVMDSGGNFLQAIGGDGSGNGQFLWTGNSYVSINFDGPLGITHDYHGNVWVTDAGNCRIQEFDKDGNYLNQFGSCGSGDGQFSQPSGIVYVPYDTVWVDDALPTGATASTPGIYNYGYSLTNEAWNWLGSSPSPYSGSLAQQSPNTAEVHQAYFTGATSKLSVGTGTALFAYVYLDPTNPPTEIMLQFSANNGTEWYRAYWGANSVPWGVDGTTTRHYMGPLPPTGRWIRLVVPSSVLGLEGSSLDCLAFTLYGGKATWDKMGAAE